MGQVFNSAGVYTQEIDETFTAPSAGAAGAALVGLAEKGPAFTPTRVANFGEFRTVFGNLNTKFYMPYAARSYLRNADNLTVVRVLGQSTAQVGGGVLIAFPQNSAATSGAATADTVLAVLRFRSDSPNQVSMSGTKTNFSLTSGTTIVRGLSMDKSSPSYIKKVLGTDSTAAKSGDSLTALYVDAVFDYKYNDVGTGTSSSGGIYFATSVQVTGGYSSAASPMIVSQNYKGSVYNLFQFHHLGHGNYTNTDVKVSITQVDITATADPSFTVVVRSAKDNDMSPAVLETFTDVNLNPSSKKFIGRVIGDRRATYSLSEDPPVILYDGNYPNNSQYIRVQVEDGYPSDARPSGFAGLAGINRAEHYPSVTSEVDTRGSVNSAVFMGVNFDDESIFDRLKASIVSATDVTVSSSGLVFVATASDSTVAVSNYEVVSMIGALSASLYNSTNRLRFTVPLYGGFDGLDPRSNLLNDSNDGTLSADFITAMNTLKNTEEVDINLVAIPDCWSSAAGSIGERLIDLCTSRGDCFTLIDLASSTTTGSGLSLTPAEAITEAAKFDSNYAACYYPWVRINDPDNDKLVWVPPSVEIMGVYSLNDRVAQPWWAPAGFNRGGMNNVLEARRRLNQSNRDDLYAKNVNPIASFPAQGIAVFGQKTLQKKDTVLNRVNVRRMLLEVRKAISNMARLFVFEPNDPSSRSNLLRAINNYLSTVQSMRGLSEFRAVLDETTTTPDLIDRNVMKGKIYLKPTAVAEIIMLDFSVTPQGASLSD